MTMCFNPIKIEKDSFPAGTNDDTTHVVAKQAIFDIVATTLSKISVLRDHEKEALETLIEKTYHDRAGDFGKRRKYES